MYLSRGILHNGFWKLYLAVLLILIGTLGVTAQQQHYSSSKADSLRNPRYPLTKPVRPKPIRTDFSVGIRMNTNGWSGFMEKGWVRSEFTKESDKLYNRRVFQIEFSEHKHPKQWRETNTMLSGLVSDKPRPFVYGKVNNFYTLKLGYGYSRMIAGKPNQGNISVHWLYLGGVSMAFLKPYYIDVYVSSQDNPGFLEKKTIRYTGENEKDFLGYKQNIVGSSGLIKGIDETQLVPGIHAKTALHFDFAADTRTKLAIEIGINGELYTQKIKIMANQKDYPYVVNAYISFQFGKRW
jgi:TM2 domain-containing membrane protein YozV